MFQRSSAFRDVSDTAIELAPWGRRGIVFMASEHNRAITREGEQTIIPSFAATETPNQSHPLRAFLIAIFDTQVLCPPYSLRSLQEQYFLLSMAPCCIFFIARDVVEDREDRRKILAPSLHWVVWSADLGMWQRELCRVFYHFLSWPLIFSRSFLVDILGKPFPVLAD